MVSAASISQPSCTSKAMPMSAMVAIGAVLAKGMNSSGGTVKASSMQANAATLVAGAWVRLDRRSLENQESSF